MVRGRKKEIILNKCLRVDYSNFVDDRDYYMLHYSLREA